MFLERTYYYNAWGGGGELRSILEERVNKAKAEGKRAFLYRYVTFDDGPTFVTGAAHDDLESYEKSRDHMLSSPQFGELAVKLGPLTRRHVRHELYKIIIAPSGGRVSGRYIHTAYFYPAVGKSADVSSILEELTRSYQAERPSFRYFRKVFSPEKGQVLVIGDHYDNLTEYENLLDHRPGSVIEAVNKAESLCREPMLHELYEVLISGSN